MNQDEIRMKTLINKIIAYQDKMGVGFKRRICYYKMSEGLVSTKCRYGL